MSLPRNLFMTAFRQQRLGLMLAAIMTILVYFATIAAMGQSFMANAAMAWSHSQQNRLTVEVPPPENAETSRTARVAQIVSALEAMPEVATTRVVSAADTARLLEPWLKDGALARSLPLPSLIDVELAAGRQLEAEALRGKLSGIVANVGGDDPAAWLAELRTLIGSLGLIAAMMVMLTGVMLMIAIGLICRAAMAVQHETIELLHLLGATDGEIARQFQRHTLRLAWPSAAAGFALALLTLIVIAYMLQNFAARLMTVNPSGFVWSLAILFVPLLAILCATLTARFAVLKRLRQIL